MQPLSLQPANTTCFHLSGVGVQVSKPVTAWLPLCSLTHRPSGSPGLCVHMPACVWLQWTHTHMWKLSTAVQLAAAAPRHIVVSTSQPARHFLFTHHVTNDVVLILTKLEQGLSRLNADMGIPFAGNQKWEQGSVGCLLGLALRLQQHPI